MNDKLSETRVQEIKDNNGEVVERIVETWVEKVPMELKTRVVEKVAPVVVERKIENYEGDKLMNTNVEVINLTSMYVNNVNNNVKIKGLAAMEDRVNTNMAKKVIDVAVWLGIAVLSIYLIYSVFA